MIHSDIPTVPVPRQTKEEKVEVLMNAYRAESARLARLAESLRELGYDPEVAA